MRRYGLVAVVLAGVFALSACGGSDAPPESEPSDAETHTAEATETPEPSTEPTLEPQDVCAGYFDGPDGGSLEDRVLDAVSGIGSSIDEAYVRKMASIGEEIETLLGGAPPDLSGPLRKIQLPFTQAADLLRAGGGEATFDTGAVRDGILPLMEACIDYGFTVSDG